jgi:hypothetical protein
MNSIENFNSNAFNMYTLKHKIFKERILNEINDLLQCLEMEKKENSNNDEIVKKTERIEFLKSILKEAENNELVNIIKNKEDEINKSLDQKKEEIEKEEIKKEEKNKKKVKNNTTNQNKNWSGLSSKEKLVKIHEYCENNKIPKEKENKLIESFKNKKLTAKMISYDKNNMKILKINP